MQALISSRTAQKEQTTLRIEEPESLRSQASPVLNKTMKTIWERPGSGGFLIIYIYMYCIYIYIYEREIYIHIYQAFYRHIYSIYTQPRHKTLSAEVSGAKRALQGRSVPLG